MKNVKTFLGVILCSILLVAVAAITVHADTQKVEKGITIQSGKKVSIEYTLKLENKEIVDTNVGKQPLTYTQGSHAIIPGLEKAMEGMKVGESKHVTVKPNDGYGPVQKKAIVEVGKDKLPPDAWKEGASIQARGSGGQILHGKLIKIKGDKATIDFNHPLAGKTLFFDVKVLTIQ